MRKNFYDRPNRLNEFLCGVKDGQKGLCAHQQYVWSWNNTGIDIEQPMLSCKKLSCGLSIVEAVITL